MFLLQKFVRFDFYLSFAAMTFSVVISATALLKGSAFLMGQFVNSDALSVAVTVLVAIEAILPVCIVPFVIVRYARFFIREFTTSKA